MKGEFVAERISEKPVAILTADLKDGFGEWRIEYSSDPRTVEAIVKPPEWCPVEWRVPTDAVNPADPRLEALLLTKVRLVFDAAFSVHDEISTIDKQILSRLNISALRESAQAEALPISMHAYLWANGEVSAEMQYDQKLSPLGSASLAQTEFFAQQMMRRELRSRLA